MELLYTVGALLILVLLWRGIVALRDHQRRIKLRLEPVPPGAEAVDSFPELGKVRVRPRFSDEAVADDGEPALGPVIIVSPRGQEEAPGNPQIEAVPAASLRTASGASSIPAREVPATVATPDVLPVAPVKADARTEEAAGDPMPPHRRSGNAAETAAVRADPSLPDAGRPEAPGTPEGEALPVLLTPVAQPLPDAAQQDMFANEMIAPPPMPSRARNRAESLYGAPAVEPVSPVRPPDTRSPVEIQDVIALHVVAREHPFNGEDLLRCILGYGLRFGDMSIFHRHERPTGQGEVLFSMAKAVEPGTFDLQAMTGEEIPGVSFFQSLPGVNSILAYDIMVDTAKRLATELRGEILDEQQQPLTRQLVEHYRERVQEFERRRLMQRPAR